jgi:dGTPase
VSQPIRESIEQRELVQLSPYAAKAAESAGREVEIPQDPVRTCYQRDRDRILHSKAFRRLKHKTQVFIDPRGDHYRTRLTHTLEVAQIARTVGRALRLNEDLIEAIALGHDLGHTPFGHPGESALDEAVREASAGPGLACFRHDEQSLRIVDVLENLNLTEEARLGIAGHSKGQGDLTDHDGIAHSTLEAAVVRISDRIAYLNHDLDDAIRSRIVDDIPERFQAFGTSQSARIGHMVMDLISGSLEQSEIRLSPDLLEFMNDLKDWLFEHVYHRYPAQYPDIAKAKRIVKYLYGHFLEPGNLPDGYLGAQGAVDYVAGMTDRFAIDTFIDLQLPRVWITPV